MKHPEPAALLRMHRSARGLDELKIARIAECAEVVLAEDGWEMDPQLFPL